MRTSDWSSDVCSSDLVVVEPGLSPLKQFDLLTEGQLYKAQDEYGDDAFVAKIGAEAIRDLLIAIDLEKERENIRQELAETTSELKPKKLVKRLKLEMGRRSGRERGCQYVKNPGGAESLTNKQI